METTRLFEKTAKEREFERKLNALVKQSGKLDDEAVKRVHALLRDARARVADAVVRSGGFDKQHLLRIKTAIQETFEDFARRYSGQMREELDKAWEMGKRLIDEPLIGTGLQMEISALPRIGLRELEILQGFSADLIKGLKEDAIKKINNQITLGIMGDQPPQQIMKEIGNVLLGKRRNVAYDAERIARTEINRVLNLGTQTRMEQAGEMIPGMKKFWIHEEDDRVRPSHRKAGVETNPKWGGTPIGWDEDFQLDGEFAFGPHAPGLSAAQSISCRCRLGYFVEERKQESWQL